MLNAVVKKNVVIENASHPFKPLTVQPSKIVGG